MGLVGSTRVSSPAKDKSEPESQSDAADGAALCSMTSRRDDFFDTADPGEVIETAVRASSRAFTSTVAEAEAELLGVEPRLCMAFETKSSLPDSTLLFGVFPPSLTPHGGLLKPGGLFKLRPSSEHFGDSTSDESTATIRALVFGFRL